MRAIVKKFTNEGAVVETEGREYLLPKGGFGELRPKQSVEIQLCPDGRAYLAENEVHEGEIRVLTALQKTSAGWFFATGTPKDLFVPFAESHPRVRPGDSVALLVCRDQKGRLYGTMQLKAHLKKGAPYRENDEVEGIVYSIRRDMGVFVAIDDKYDARLDARDARRSYEVGDRAKFRVGFVLPDGKIRLSERMRGHLQMDRDSVHILQKLQKHAVLPIGDKSSPEEILRLTGLSKQSFKRAAGRLKKMGLAEIGPDRIRRRIE